MATTPLTYIPLPHYFVDVESLGEGHLTTQFEVRRDTEKVPAKAMMIPANADRNCYFLCFRYLDEPFVRTTVKFRHPSRLQEPTQYSLSGRNVYQEVVSHLEHSLWSNIFLVDARQLGAQGYYWLYLNSDLRSGGWLNWDNLILSKGFQIEPYFPNFVAALGDKDADIRFVLYWLGLSAGAQIKLSTFYRNGSEKEMHQMVLAIALHESSRQQHKELMYHNGFLDENWYRYMKIGAPPPKFHIPYPAPTLRLEMWGKHVRNYFHIDGDIELARKHPWLRPIQPKIDLDCFQATYHEIIEATLFLREWARDKMPPDELSVLLPTL